MKMLLTTCIVWGGSVQGLSYTAHLPIPVFHFFGVLLLDFGDCTRGVEPVSMKTHFGQKETADTSQKRRVITMVYNVLNCSYAMEDQVPTWSFIDSHLDLSNLVSYSYHQTPPV
ncbi:uncharacterized protein EV420DRAFT_1567115 [Desarmillaria tabescens]|uniref:Uncharacterized protein n=1 Tax=Armillaria tabescens TaxID=1929756 RepID=A0AA39JX79_ARMTA|nr:uncharacterized protein EV420DRAFT_1567115 [Desarmillaria tabescens]KAK0448273.1 hypothetical protein EV420DRAFT_1567115 [Desarmillaria tabescens]